ncbi:MAG: 16S rRNA (guanine(966)-N(2))-methyltransferase RsmD [Lentisphaeria bacterium]
MRIVSGKAKGIKLTAPKGRSLRPTEDRVKEALFATLGNYVQNAMVLDLFSGTGALGLEALSRGAENVYMFEKAPAHLPYIKQNILAVQKSMQNNCGLCKLFSTDAKNAPTILNSLANKINLILADPPYDVPKNAFGAEALLLDTKLAEWCAPECILVLEHHSDTILPWNENAGWKLLKQKKMGIRTISFAKKQ